MPTYEYRCTACEDRTEAVQSFSDPPLTICEACGGALKRVFHPVGVVLKGSGFYSTDNRPGKRSTPKEPAKSSAGSSDPAPASGSGGKAEGGSPTKKTGSGSDGSSASSKSAS